MNKMCLTDVILVSYPFLLKFIPVYGNVCRKSTNTDIFKSSEDMSHRVKG